MPVRQEKEGGLAGYDMGVTRVLMVFKTLVLNEATKGVSEDRKEKRAQHSS